MNASKIFQKRFLIYALLLHGGVGLSFLIFNGEEVDSEKEVKRIVEVDISAPAPKSVLAETFSEEDLAEEMQIIESMSQGFSNSSKLKEANIKEKEKEYKALEKQSKKMKDKIIKDKKKLQKEKNKIENEKQKAKKEKEQLEKEKKKLEKEILQMREEAKKKLAKKKKDEAQKKRLAEKKKADQIAKDKIKKEMNQKKWLDTSEGKSEFVRYSSSLMGEIRGRWIRPIEAKAGWACKLDIKQDRKGRIKGVKKVKCNPNNNKFYQSVYNAVMQSSPLPVPKDKRLFDEKVTITFSVE